MRFLFHWEISNREQCVSYFTGKYLMTSNAFLIESFLLHTGKAKEAQEDPTPSWTQEQIQDANAAFERTNQGSEGKRKKNLKIL